MRIAVVVAVVALMAAVPALAADQPADVKALTEQVKSLQNANVVMKEDLAKTQLKMADMASQNRAQTEASNAQIADLAKQIAELRQALADEKAAHEAALAKEKAEREAALAEAERQRHRAKQRQLWLYVAGAVGLGLALSH
jgi:uncharacterized protein YjcR